VNFVYFVSRPRVRPIAWVLALFISSGLLAGYCSIMANLAAREGSGEVDEELALAVQPELIETPLELNEICGRTTVPSQDVGCGWPGILGPAGDCSSPERGLNWEWLDSGPPLLWRSTVGSGYSSPVVLGNRLILFHRLGDREVLDCLAATNGRPIWSYSWPTAYKCPTNYSSGPYSTPVLDRDRVYALGAEGKLICLDLDSGTLLWKRDLHRDYNVLPQMWPASSSPLLEDNRLIINLGGSSTGAGIVALDRDTGGTLWSATEDTASCSTPVGATIEGRRYVFVWTAEALVSLSPVDGSVFWRIPFSANNRESAHGTSPLVTGDIVVISGYQIGNLCVRVLPDGNPLVLWRDKRQVLDSQYRNLFRVGNHICGFSSTRRSMRCLDLESGDLVWKWQSKIRNGTTLAVDGRYLIFGVRGRLAALSINGCGVELLSMTSRPLLKSPCYSYPAFHNGLLYVRNEEEILCLDIRLSATNIQSRPDQD